MAFTWMIRIYSISLTKVSSFKNLMSTISKLKTDDTMHNLKTYFVFPDSSVEHMHTFNHESKIIFQYYPR